MLHLKYNLLRENALSLFKKSLNPVSLAISPQLGHFLENIDLFLIFPINYEFLSDLDGL